MQFSHITEEHRLKYFFNCPQVLSKIKIPSKEITPPIYTVYSFTVPMILWRRIQPESSSNKQSQGRELRAKERK